MTKYHIVFLLEEKIDIIIEANQVYETDYRVVFRNGDNIIASFPAHICYYYDVSSCKN